MIISTVPWGTMLLSLSVLVLESTCTETKILGLVLTYCATANTDFYLDNVGCKVNEDIILIIICTTANYMTPVARPFKRFNSTESVAWVGWQGVYDCGLLNTSFADTLAALNVNVTGITGFALDNPSQPLNASHFKGLNLRSVIIMNSYFKHEGLNLNFLEPLTALTNLMISYANISSLPASTRIENVVLYKGASFGAWGGCTELRQLKLISWDIKDASDDWLSHCSKLVVMDLKSMNRVSMNRFSQTQLGVTALRSLNIDRCDTDTADNDGNRFRIYMFNLTRVNLTFNRLTRIPIHDMYSLKELNMTSNNLRRLAFVEKKDSLFSIPKLTLDNNPDLDFCYLLEFLGRIPNFSTVQLSLRNTKTGLCLRGREPIKYPIKMKLLEFLDLRGNEINTLKFSGLPLTSARRFELDLRDNDIDNVELDSSDYAMLEKTVSKRNVTIKATLSLECDCSEGLFARALRENMLSVPGAHCRDGRCLVHVPPEQLECNRSTCGNCTCRRPWNNSAAVDMECGARGLLALPSEPGVRKLYASDNLIESFSATDLPDTLLYLDISRNHIARLDASAAAALFSVPERRVRLAGNPVICSCDNLPLLRAVQEHHAQVEDYDLITCSGEDRLLHNVSTTELCYLELAMGLAVGVGVLVALASILAVVYYRHESAVKAYLYARGCCLWWLREDELDADKQYDAFVSFSHQDEEYVVDTLLPGLERAPHAYKLCLHSRDWLVGEWIAAQIMHSVEQSRRTIIVLSRNFLESRWGLHEFRTAHLSTLQEGRRRIIVVVLDDVVDDDRLSPELKAYLTSNTYVRFDDKWFWDKLVYAMPHRAACSDAAAVVEPEVDVLPTVAKSATQTTEV